MARRAVRTVLLDRNMHSIHIQDVIWPGDQSQSLRAQRRRVRAGCGGSQANDKASVSCTASQPPGLGCAKKAGLGRRHVVEARPSMDGTPVRNGCFDRLR
jgi:hypothetical protein